MIDYAQESGGAGWDGLLSEAVLVVDGWDLMARSDQAEQLWSGTICARVVSNRDLDG